MLGIERNIFLRNLKVTQAFCRVRTAAPWSDHASVLRGFNPTWERRPLFSFKETLLDPEFAPTLKSCTLVRWAVDPLLSRHQFLIDTLFDQQMSFKREQNYSAQAGHYAGEIWSPK